MKAVSLLEYILLVASFLCVNAELPGFGVCYDPFHNSKYHNDIRAALSEDFNLISKYASSVRTYYSSHKGVSVVEYARSAGLKLYLGIHMTNEHWYGEQVNAAVEAVNKYPDTVLAIIVGNENLQPNGPYSVDHMVNEINMIKHRIGGKVPVGTSQRINEWLHQPVQSLIDACDIVGANIYPFFTPGFDSNKPLALLDEQWNRLKIRAGAHKIRLTETGFASDGTSPGPNQPNFEHANIYYRAFREWTAGGQDRFYFSMFDRSPKQRLPNSYSMELHFGIVRFDGSDKFGTISPVKPTTKPPTTKPPTTKPPTTKPPTTKPPTTKPPTTKPPTTKPPTTRPPTTQPPTTQPPTTKTPTTQPPTTRPPTTQPPTTRPPTKTPTTQPPTTKAPTTKAPTTKAPTTKAPTTRPPTTQPPTRSPTTQPPTTRPPTTKAPTSSRPTPSVISIPTPSAIHNKC